MTDRSSPAAQAVSAEMRSKRRISIVWIVPLVALVIGVVLAYKAISEKGPTITITFASADGMEAGKTKIKFKDVEIGQVESIELSEDASKVVLTAQMVKEAQPYLTDQTKFWVVRPRVSGGSVSGLSTMLSGAYIGIDTNRQGAPARHFTGLEVPPVVTVDQPGRHYLLQADALGSLDIGAPVYFRQIQVGQVVGYKLHQDGNSVDINVFVEEPHDAKVTTTTRFWNASGVDLSLNAQGLKLNTQSIVSILAGGIAFGLPKDSPPGEVAEENTHFHLYPDRDSIEEKQYTIRNYYALLFDESVRGLSIGAPVELYGIKLGEVVDLKLEFDLEQNKFFVPVIVAIEPERVRVLKNNEPVRIDNTDHTALIKSLVEQEGLRAQLQSGNLLTGQLMVNMVFVDDAPKADLGSWNGFITLPTTSGSFQRLQEGLTRIVDNLEKVRFDRIGEELAQTLKEVQTAVAEIGKMVKTLNRETSPKLQATLSELQKTLVEVQQGIGKDSPLNYSATRSLKELHRTLASIRELVQTLEHQPQSLLFGKESTSDD